MRIAFISYEYPPDTSGGGIGTYVYQVSTLLEKDHHVFVFCGTCRDNYQYREGKRMIFRIKSLSKEDFRKSIVDFFCKKNLIYQFDLVEGPDYGADAYFVKLALPQLPYVVKLHTPSFLIKLYSNYYYQYVWPKMFFRRTKCVLKKIVNQSSLRKNTFEEDIEFRNVNLADLLISPSNALSRRVKGDWKINRDIRIVINPYISSRSLLEIPLCYHHRRITFIGKLSILKGLIDTELAISMILSRFPDLKFRFIGMDSFSPLEGTSMKEYILKRNKKWCKNIEFTGKVPIDEIPHYLRETDIVICNSLWENFPNVILESMSAGRIVIATKVGGIPEIIKHKKNGLLIKPRSPRQLFRAIFWVYTNDYKLHEIGNNARRDILQIYNNTSILKKEILNDYKIAISKCKSL